uniref:F-box domain-containing protein n=1 Tax=Setaria viridis TaxID=4556 RepID=A0A4U6V087_SETVI|nr:hypothetical protein SEVIR_4G221300v2 [Setaria viridis]
MATLYPDWAGLPQEMVATVMRALDIPDLFRAGTVCSSWYAAYSDVRRVRIPITDAAPCLLYSARDNGDASDATLYSPSSGGKAFKVRLPDPPLGSRALVGSSHGWLAAADEASNLHLVNPLTGAQVALPPVMALYHVESSVDEQGSLEYSVQEGEDPDDPVRYPAQKLRLFLYYKVAMSCSPSKVRDRIVLLLHRPDGQISFAHIGDDNGYRDALYNKNDGLFCVLSFDGSMLTLDLSDPSSPVAKDIVLAADRWFFSFHSAKRV